MTINNASSFCLTLWAVICLESRTDKIVVIITGIVSVYNGLEMIDLSDKEWLVRKLLFKPSNGVMAMHTEGLGSGGSGGCGGCTGSHLVGV